MQARNPSMRERLDALDWVRKEMMRKGSPDFLRQQLRERQIQKTCADLLRSQRETEAKRRNGR